VPHNCIITEVVVDKLIHSRETRDKEDVTLHDNIWYVLSKIQVKRQDNNLIWAVLKAYEVPTGSEHERSTSQAELQKIISLQENQAVLTFFPMFIMALTIKSRSAFKLQKRKNKEWQCFEGLVWQQLSEIGTANAKLYRLFINYLTNLHKAGYIHGNVSRTKFMYLTTVSQQSSTSARRRSDASHKDSETTSELKLINLKTICKLPLNIIENQDWYQTVWSKVQDSHSEETKQAYMVSWVMILFDLNKLALDDNPLIDLKQWCQAPDDPALFSTNYIEVHGEIFENNERTDNHSLLFPMIPFNDEIYRNQWNVEKIMYKLSEYPRFTEYLTNISIKQVTDFYLQIFLNLQHGTEHILLAFKNEITECLIKKGKIHGGGAAQAAGVGRRERRGARHNAAKAARETVHSTEGGSRAAGAAKRTREHDEEESEATQYEKNAEGNADFQSPEDKESSVDDSQPFKDLRDDEGWPDVDEEGNAQL